jgi:hypothetical protein
MKIKNTKQNSPVVLYKRKTYVFPEGKDGELSEGRVRKFVRRPFYLLLRSHNLYKD